MKKLVSIIMNSCSLDELCMVKTENFVADSFFAEFSKERTAVLNKMIISVIDI